MFPKAGVWILKCTSLEFLVARFVFSIFGNFSFFFKQTCASLMVQLSYVSFQKIMCGIKKLFCQRLRCFSGLEVELDQKPRVKS